MQDFIFNGQAHGSVANRLLSNNGDVGCLRPWTGADGKSYMTTMNAEGKLVSTRIADNSSTLTYEQWRTWDTAIHKAARQRLSFVADLRSSGMQHVIGNGMGKTVFSSQQMTDPGSATISMDGTRRGNGDRPEFTLTNLPLPIIHSDFSFPLREILVSRGSGAPLDMTMAEAAGRRVAEAAEQFALGNSDVFQFGGGSIYGLINFPNRITYSHTLPTDVGWTPLTTVNEILEMKQLSVTAKNYGPWILYASTNWDQYLDRDYAVSGGNNPSQTLRERIGKINGIKAIKTLDYLTGYQLVLVQQTSDTFREVIGMDMTTVQWEEQGGMMLNFKVMCIMVPQPRADINGNCGIVHAS